jgi:Cu+-exporting ATPase
LDEITLHIYGMTCSSCTSTVETELGKMPGTMGVAVSLATETAKVSFDRGLIGPREMVERVEELGFDATLSDQQDATQLHSLTHTKKFKNGASDFSWVSHSLSQSFSLAW